MGRDRDIVLDVGSMYGEEMKARFRDVGFDLTFVSSSVPEITVAGRVPMDNML